MLFFKNQKKEIFNSFIPPLFIDVLPKVAVLLHTVIWMLQTKEVFLKLHASHVKKLY